MRGDLRTPEGIDKWWARVVPSDSLRTKIIKHISESGPSSAYDISKSIYKVAIRGYGAVYRNLKELEAEKILQQIGVAKSESGLDKKLYAISEYAGIPCCWAYLGTDLDFNRLVSTHEQVFKKSRGLNAYRSFWEVLGPQPCVSAARKSFLGIITGLDNREILFAMVVAYLLDGSLPRTKIEKILELNEFKGKNLVRTSIEDLIENLQELLETMSKISKRQGKRRG